MRPAGASGAECPFLSGARLSGLLLRFVCPRDEVESRLARYGPLRLARARDCPEGYHPVHCEIWRITGGLVRFGRLDQRQWAERLGSLWGGSAGLRWATSLVEWNSRALGSYSELMMSVPGVTVRGGGIPHRLVLGMITDSALARWADKAFGFGYGKRAGTFATAAPGQWDVVAHGRTLLSVTTRPPAREEEPVDSAHLEASWRLPLLGRPGSGRLALSHLERSCAAGVYAVTASVALSEQFVPGLGAGNYRSGRCVDPRACWAVRFDGVAARVSYPRAL